MAISIENIRELLLPGLMSVSGSYSALPVQWEVMLAATEEVEAAPLLSVPVSLPVAVAIGAAAVVIKNPTVTRRFFSWFKARDAAG
jgi:hypothetical protein